MRNQSQSSKSVYPLTDESTAIPSYVYFGCLILANTFFGYASRMLTRFLSDTADTPYDDMADQANQINSVVSITCKDAFEETQPPLALASCQKKFQNF